MARNGLIRQRLTATGLALVAFAASGCAQKLTLGEPNIPDSGAMSGPASYRALSTIPSKPPVTSQETNQQALDALAAEGKETARAAEQLRGTPFDMPAPAPSPVEIGP